jgi:hypothetical protein
MSKETFQQMIDRVTKKQAATTGAPPKPPKIPLPKR